MSSPSFPIVTSIRAKIVAWLKDRKAFVDAGAEVDEVDALGDVWAMKPCACAVWWAQAEVVPGPDGQPLVGGSGEMTTAGFFLAIKSSSILSRSSALSNPDGVVGAEILAASVLDKCDGLRKVNIGTDGEIGMCFLNFAKMAVVPHPSIKDGGVGPKAVVIHFVTSAFEL